MDIVAESSSQAKRRARLMRNDNDDDYNEGSASQRIRSDADAVNWDEEALSRKINDTVRYALACEYRRVPIRRDDINKKILQERTREFNNVLAGTQRKLRHLFGMELVELPARDKSLLRKPLRDTGKATTSAKSFVLCNILDKAYYDPELILQTDEEYQLRGVLFVILALILANEQSLEDVVLKEHLDRLKVNDESTTFGDRDKLLDTFVKQGYLQKIKLGDESITVDAVWEYRWGSRASAEIKESQIIDFIASVYDMEGADLEKLRTYIYKAAGYNMRS